ncbi:Cyclin, N-terminal domain containing protein [Tritrichomonas foetus]|uniref:Cyclin, N-terminal domain containing protein n=1 Tax=Tritrichomonas foetus TaxID=1144522 RepID=A0A1J4JCN6_9EUKA|nr:Cyclin, N-terminal domain containing protein [Tritrichomonas foetus]|eukprot:OHS96433.1 Cyclin, N-terminal domain containing protein [Tritrichomonas foetus]
MIIRSDPKVKNQIFDQEQGDDYEDTTDYSDQFPDDDIKYSISTPQSFLEKLQSASLFTTMREAHKYTIQSSTITQTQKEITVQTRLAVVDWIFRVVDRVRYSRETFFNSIAVLDHVLSKISLTKQNIQLYAATCLWISAKLYETKNRELNIFTAVCQNQYQQDDFTKTEMDIITCLEGCIEYPTPQIFIQALLIDTDLKDCEKLCNFFLDISLSVGDFDEIPAHLVAAAAIVVSATSIDKYCPMIKLLTIIHYTDQASLLKVARSLVDVAHSIVEKNVGGIFAFYAKDSHDYLANAVKKATEYLQNAVH